MLVRAGMGREGRRIPCGAGGSRGKRRSRSPAVRYDGAMDEDRYSGWLKARFDLLRGSIERAYALLAAPRSDHEDWRTAVAAETFLWRAIRDAEAPDVPERFAEVHRRGVALLDGLTGAGDALRTAIEARDVDLLAGAMRQMKDAEKLARSTFAAAYRAMDG